MRNQWKCPIFRACMLTCKQALWPQLFITFFHVNIMNVNHAKFQKKFDSRNNFKGITLNYNFVTLTSRPMYTVSSVFTISRRWQSWNFLGTKVFTWENSLVWNTRCGCWEVMWKRSIRACELSCRKYAISELTCASVSRRVLVQNPSYEN